MKSQEADQRARNLHRERNQMKSQEADHRVRIQMESHLRMMAIPVPVLPVEVENHRSSPLQMIRAQMPYP